MKKEAFLKLVDQYIEGNISPAEKTLVEEYLRRLESDDFFQLTEEEELRIKQTMQANINRQLGYTQPKWKRPVTRYAAAAVLIISAGYALFFFYNRPKIAQDTLAISKQLIPPGSNKAILTLADGSQIVLNDSLKGNLAQQGNITIKKTTDGQLIYQVTGNTKANEIGDNLITTPRGGQYQIILPDKSHVWLNAASSIKFPATFAGNVRRVKITGEAYFEVAHNPLKPFQVETRNGVSVEVLGTHFNVNAYDDEPQINATLLSGSVQVTSGTANKVIKPGEQAQISANQSSRISVFAVNTANVVAWKDDLLVFANEDIQVAMRRIARWYNVEVIYPKGIPDKTIGGTINKFKDINELLKLIELTGGVRFKIEGRRILVMS